MIQSRCGILCSECDYKNDVNCDGCVVIKIPFWSEQCDIKSCCENKELEHCGECLEFPCNIMIEYAYHPENGDNGKRIEQCRKWKS